MRVCVRMCALEICECSCACARRMTRWDRRGVGGDMCVPDDL